MNSIWPDDSYVSYLRQSMSGPGKPARKGDRTRLALMAAAAKLLDGCGFHAMRVSDICKQAKVSPGTLYLYFGNKLELTKALLDQFVRDLLAAPDLAVVERDHFRRMCLINLGWIRLVRANPGLFRCLLDADRDLPEFAAFQAQCNQYWYDRVAEGLLTRTGTKSRRTHKPAATLVAYLMGGMVDELTRSAFIRREEGVIKALDEAAMDDEELAEFLALVAYRAFYGVSPDSLLGKQAKWLASRSIVR